MTEQEALGLLKDIASAVANKNIEIFPGQDFRADNLLDSLDTIVFFMELEKRTGLAVPEIESMVENDWYNVDTLCRKIAQLQNNEAERT